MFPSPLGEQGKSTKKELTQAAYDAAIVFPSPLGEQGKSTGIQADVTDGFTTSFRPLSGNRENQLCFLCVRLFIFQGFRPLSGNRENQHVSFSGGLEYCIVSVPSRGTGKINGMDILHSL